MSVDSFPMLLADDIAASMSCQNSLTHREIEHAKAALRHLVPDWSLECGETHAADAFLDLSTVLADGRCVSFIIHRADGAIQVLRMVQDDPIRLGTCDAIAPAIAMALAAITPGGRRSHTTDHFPTV